MTLIFTIHCCAEFFNVCGPMYTDSVIIPKGLVIIICESLANLCLISEYLQGLQLCSDWKDGVYSDMCNNGSGDILLQPIL